MTYNDLTPTDINFTAESGKIKHWHLRNWLRNRENIGDNRSFWNVLGISQVHSRKLHELRRGGGLARLFLQQFSEFDSSKPKEFPSMRNPKFVVTSTNFAASQPKVRSRSGTGECEIICNGCEFRKTRG
jgi:hypothetical protein